MNIGDRLKAIGGLAVGYDKPAMSAVLKSMPQMYYQQTRGIHQYSYQPDFNIIEPERYRSLIYGGYAANNFVQLFHCVPEIFAPIHAIASRIANADFQLRKSYNDEIIYNNKAWNALFNQPNPLQHFRELIYEAVVYEYVTGNEYMYFNTPSTLAKSFENVVAIWNLPADQIEPVHARALKLYSATTIEDLISTYKLDENNSYAPKDVLHIRAINLEWNDRKLKGKPNLLSADKAIANLIAVYEARNVIYTKRGALGFIVSKKSDGDGLTSLTKFEKDDLRAQYEESYGLTGVKSPVGITGAPIDYIKVGATIAELEPFKETMADALAIYAALQVPRELMPMEAGATYENQDKADKGFYQNVIIPKAMSYCQSITNKLGLNEMKLYLHPSFDNVESLQENKKEKAEVNKLTTETARQKFLNGIITLNEWAVEDGREKKSNPLYDKLIYDMDETEFAKVKEIVTLKSVTNGTGNQTEGAEAGNSEQGGNQGAQG